MKRTESGRASIVLGMLSHSVTMLCDCESYCFAYRLPPNVLTPERRVPTLSRRCLNVFYFASIETVSQYKSSEQLLLYQSALISI